MTKKETIVSSLFAISMLFTAPGLAEDIHPRVQAALDWTLPVNTCKPPKMKNSHVTSDQARKLKKDSKKYKKCTEKYRKLLLKENKSLMGVAKYGLTQPQAEVILKHIALVQKTYKASAAVVRAPASNVPESANERYDSHSGH